MANSLGPAMENRWPEEDLSEPNQKTIQTRTQKPLFGPELEERRNALASRTKVCSLILVGLFVALTILSFSKETKIREASELNEDKQPQWLLFERESTIFDGEPIDDDDEENRLKAQARNDNQAQDQRKILNVFEIFKQKEVAETSRKPRTKSFMNEEKLVNFSDQIVLSNGSASSSKKFENSIGKSRETLKVKQRQKRSSMAPINVFHGATSGAALSQADSRLNSKNSQVVREFRRFESMRFVLMCQVLDGDGPIEIKWFKDNQELSFDFIGSSRSNSSRQEDSVELLGQDELGSSLLFRRVNFENSGNYTCIASNPFGSSAYSSIMSVKVPPKWKLEPQDQESIMGEQITIDCQATGNPNPFIRWKFANNLNSVQQQQLKQQQQQQQHPAASTQPTLFYLMGQQRLEQTTPSSQLEHQSIETLLAAGSAFKLLNSNHHVQTLENGSLSIRQANKLEHEGFYMCEADNGIEPNLIKILKLIVHLQAQFLDEIQLIQAASSAELSGGANLILGPQARGSIAATAGAASGALQAVSGLQQQQLSKLVRLAQNTTQIRLLCQPFGDAPLTMNWFKDGQLIYTHTQPIEAAPSSFGQSVSSATQASDLNGGLSNNQDGRYHVSTRKSSLNLNKQSGGVVYLESELIITNLKRSDAGQYTCLARNTFGQGEKKLRLILQEAPEAPEAIDVAHIGSRSIGLRWLAPFDGNSQISKYLIEYRKHSELSGDLQQHSKISEKLIPASKSIEQQALVVGLEQQQQQSEQQPQQQQVQHTLHELEPLTRYSIRVSAVNAVGRSRPSVPLSLKTEEEVPSTVPNPVKVVVVSSKSIKLHWTITYPSEREIIEGFFIGYRSFDLNLAGSGNEPAAGRNRAAAGEIQQQQQQQPTFTYKTIRLTNQRQQQLLNHNQQLVIDSNINVAPQDSSSAFLSPISSITKTIPSSGNEQLFSPQTEIVVVNNFEFIINGLERNTEYSILIQCFNKKGAGPASDPVVFKTFVNDPPEKLILSAEDITDTSLKVNWRFPMESLHNFIKPDDEQQVDGFFLTFAQISNPSLSRGANSNRQNNLNPNPSEVSDPLKQPTMLRRMMMINLANNKSVDQAEARIFPLNPTATGGAGQAPTNTDQWQTIQLAGQLRSHQLKNLDCGSSYAMRIYAFNKIGKGEASDLLTVSTRGKVPNPPDRRSFLSVNSTQVRLHLNAWSDGGCEIEKFIVQYKLRGQLDWILVSNNIFKEQASVLIKDLLPATSYELLVTALNQVGPSEMKYRFTTLDMDGKPVYSMNYLSGHPLFDQASESGDYLDDEMDVRRDQMLWSTGASSIKFLIKHSLNSPFVLFLLFLILASLLVLLMFYKLNNSSSANSSTSSSNNDIINNGTGSNSTSTPSNKSSSGFGAGSCSTRRGSNGDGNATILDGCEGPLSSLANESFTDSPRLNLQRLPGNQQYPSISECAHYQPFCALADTSSPAQIQDPIVDYGRTVNIQQLDNKYNMSSPNSATAGIYGQQQNNYSMNQLASSNNYASVQRSATLDLNSGPGLDQNGALVSSEQHQRCLMQMLMLSPQPNENQAQQQQQQQQSYVSALTTLARNKGGIKLNHLPSVNQNFSSNTMGPSRQQSQDNYFRHPSQGNHPELNGFAAGEHCSLISASNN